MWYLEFMAFITGGTKFGIGLIQGFMLFGLFYALRWWYAKSSDHWSVPYSAFICAYLCTGLFTLAMPLKLVTPATNVFGVIYLSIVWLFWMLGLAGVPDFLAPYLFN